MDWTGLDWTVHWTIDWTGLHVPSCTSRSSSSSAFTLQEYGTHWALQNLLVIHTDLGFVTMKGLQSLSEDFTVFRENYCFQQGQHSVATTKGSCKNSLMRPLKLPPVIWLLLNQYSFGCFSSCPSWERSWGSASASLPHMTTWMVDLLPPQWLHDVVAKKNVILCKNISACAHSFGAILHASILFLIAAVPSCLYLRRLIVPPIITRL